MDKVLNFRQGADEDQAILKVPGFALHSARRVTHKLSVYPPHEAFRKEVLETAEPRALLREALSRKTLPDIYWTHEVVQRTADEVHVAAVCLDGTPYSKKTTGARPCSRELADTETAFGCRSAQVDNVPLRLSRLVYFIAHL